MRNSGTVWTIAKQTAPLRAAKGALRDGINISVCETNSKWSVFSDPVTNILVGSALNCFGSASFWASSDNTYAFCVCTLASTVGA